MVKHHTERLILRWANIGDSEFIFKLLNNPTWIKHIGDRNIKKEEDAQHYIQKSLIESYTKNGFGMYVMERKKDQVSLGLCGFLQRDNLDSVDIGFAILPDFAKEGYTFEAAHRIISEAEFPMIYGITYEGNIASRNLLQKLGMKFLKNFQFGDYEEESMLFSLEKDS